MPKDTRSRMLDAAVTALRRQGVAGMSFSDVLDASGAARGAIYHHFPGGKSQLVAEAAQRNGDEVRGHLAGLPVAGPVQVAEEFLAMIRPVVAESSAGSGCAVAAVAMGDDPAPREVSAGVLASWVDTLAGRLTAAGLPPGDAADLATTLIALLEGAHVLCRAAGDIAPFDRAARAAMAMAGSYSRTSERKA